MADVEAWENEGGWAAQPKLEKPRDLAQELESARAALRDERQLLATARDQAAASDAAFQALIEERDRLKAELESAKRALRGIRGVAQSIATLAASFDNRPGFGVVD